MSIFPLQRRSLPTQRRTDPQVKIGRVLVTLSPGSGCAFQPQVPITTATHLSQLDWISANDKVLMNKVSLRQGLS